MKTCINCSGAECARLEEKQCRCQVPHFITGAPAAKATRCSGAVTFFLAAALLGVAAVLKGCS